MDEVPNSYRHFLTIEQDGLDYNEFEIYGYTKTIDLSSLSGRSLSIVYSNSVETSFIVAREGTVGTAPFGRDYLYSIKVTIYQDDIRDGRKVVGSFDSYTYTYPYTYLDKRTLNLKVTHPYPNINASDEEAIPYPVRRNATYAVVYGFGGADNRLVQQAQKELDRVIASDVQNDKDAVLGQSLHMMAQNWMQQTFLVDELAAKTVGALSIPYHRVGLMAQETGYYIDVKNAIGSTVRYRDVELSGITGSLAPTSEGHAIDILHRNAQFVVISAIEHGVLEQLMGSCNPGVSTMKVMELANAAGIPIHYVTSVSAFDNIKNSLAYTSSLETKMRNLLNSGGGLLLPNDGTIPSGSWNGNGYLYHSNNRISLAIGNGYNGGYASYLQPVSPPRINTVADFSFPEFSTSYELSTPKSLDPVDLSTGAFLYDHTDLSLVSPMPLSFSRSYSSENNNKESSAGHGWMHNHDIHLARHSSIGPVYGKRQYHEAVALVVSMRILSDLLERIAGINSDISANTTDAELWLIASLVANWAIDQTTDNAVTVHIGNKNLQYIKLPNGEYQPPPGVTTQLIYSGSDDPITCNGSNEVHNGTYSLVERFGTRYDFNSDDKLSKITDIDGNTVDYAYTGEKLNTVSNNFNQNLTFDYTGDNLFSVTDSSSRIVKFSYTPEGDLDIYTDPEGKTWDHDYDNHRMIRITDPTATVIVENTYDSLGRADTQKVPRSSTGQADQMEMYKFYISGFRNVEEDPEGNQMVYHLDYKGRTTAVEDALGNTSYSEHDGQNQIVKNIDARANKTITEYDSNHNVRFITDALNKKSENIYDSQFRLTDTIDPLAHRTEFKYDTEHHLKLTRDALQNTATATYYPNGTRETSTDGRAVVTNYNYDAQGNPDTTSVAAHPVIDYSYNALGQLDSLTDQEGATTSFTYDDRGLVTKITDPLNKEAILKYDDAGRLDTVKDRNLKITGFDYTRSGKVELITYASDPSVSFTYDVHDNRDSMTDALGQTHYDYDELQRLTSQTDPQGYTVGYDYDEMGNLKTLTYPDNKTASYTYDELNRLKTVKVNWLSGTPTATYIYDDAGRLERLIQFNGSNTIYIYDNANRLTDLINIKSDGTIISRHQFPDIDGNGNRLKEVRDEPVIPALPTQTVQLNYNSPQRNRLTGTSNDSFGYDTEGQQNNKSGTAYTFDDAHRLTKIGTSVEYFYDGAGNRLRDTRYGIVTRKFIYDASNNLLAQGINGEDIIVKYYIHGAGLLGMVQGNELYSYHYDATGNTLANTDLSQNIVNTYSYGAYGQIANENETIAQPFKYVGQYGVQYEVEHGLYYMRARYYDPEIGRFISEDPIGLEGGLNLYAYGAGNPIIFIDPSGLSIQDAHRSSNVSVSGRAGVFGGVSLRSAGVFQLAADVDLFSLHFGSNSGSGGPLMTQGGGVSLSIAGRSVFNLGRSRSSPDGGGSWTPWANGLSHPNFNVNNDAVNLSIGGGLFLGGQIDIPIISPAY